MIWQGTSLLSDAGATLAEHRDGELVLGGGTTLTVHHSAGSLRWEVTGEDKATSTTYSVQMQGFGVGTLIARCGSRTYRLRRDGLLGARRTIFDANGVPVALTAPRAGVDLHVEEKRETPFGDLVFMTWALTLVDTPGRNPRM